MKNRLLLLACWLALSVGCSSPPKNGLDSVLVPSLDRPWIENHARMPRARFDGDKVSIENIRNTRYLSDEDYIAQYYDAEFDLDELESVDYIMTPFQEAPALAHTMLSFGFADGRHLVVSAEARLEEGEKYHPVTGAMRQYELMYIVGDERDLLPLRTKYRGVDVYVYRSTATPDRVRRLFHDVMDRANQLAEHPEFYDTLTNNCTSNIVYHINRLQPGRIPLDIRALLPGYSDALAYELGIIEKFGDFEQTRMAARVTDRANESVGDPDFSAKIRTR